MSSEAVTLYAFYPSLLFLVCCLCALPCVSSASFPDNFVLSLCTFRGGRFVFGSGRTWPHDFRFFVGFDSAPLDAQSSEGTSRSDDDVVVDVMSSILMVLGGTTSIDGVFT